MRERVVRGVYQVGWRTASHLPARLESMIISVASRQAVRHNGTHVQNLRRNLTVLTGGPADDDLLRRAVASYLRNFSEVLALRQWSGDDIRSRITTINESVLRTAYAGAGAVVALPHSGNWDLAGAWACLTGMPVTTVAEQLADAEYADFVAFRERLGMEVLSHRDPTAISELVFAVRRRRLVCLLADRDLERTGVPVRWAGQRDHHAGRTGDDRPAQRGGADSRRCASTPRRGMRSSSAIRSRPGPAGPGWRP